MTLGKPQAFLDWRKATEGQDMKPTNNAEVSENQMTPFGKKMRDLPAERRVFSAFLMEVGSGFDPTELVKGSTPRSSCGPFSTSTGMLRLPLAIWSRGHDREDGEGARLLAQVPSPL